MRITSIKDNQLCLRVIKEPSPNLRRVDVLQNCPISLVVDHLLFYNVCDHFSILLSSTLMFCS